MKDALTDANFPQDAQGRTYHVGTKAGQVANRIITVGDDTRARRIAKHFDGGKAIFEYESHRRFLTLTGTFDGTPITVIAIGMGFSLVDFFVRECRAVVSGEMIIVRLGSCGSLLPEVPISSVVVPKASIGVSRNYDYWSPLTTAEERASGSIEPYTITRPLDCDHEVHDALLAALKDSTPSPKASLFDGKAPQALGDTSNASADSFYSSQGRQSPHFVDANANLLAVLSERHPGLATMEMETFVLNHLALSNNAFLDSQTVAPPGEPSARSTDPNAITAGRIRTGAVQMVFANRTTSAFITPDEVEALEHWTGRAVCQALANLIIPPEQLHPSGVWNTT